jgi:hypothetical protein
LRAERQHGGGSQADAGSQYAAANGGLHALSPGIFDLVMDAGCRFGWGKPLRNRLRNTFSLK